MKNGFTFGGIHSDSFGLIVNSKRIPATPAITNRLQEIGGVDGAWDYGVTYGPREIEIDVTLIGDSPIETKRSVRQLIGVMNPKKGSKPLIFDDEPDILYYARIANQVPLETLGALGTFTLQLTCPDPFAYSTMEYSFSFTNEWSGLVLGTEDTRPSLLVEHNGGSGTVALERPDGIVQILTFRSDSPAGMYSVDCKEKTITRDGNRAYSFVEGDFLSFSNGVNVAKITGNIERVSAEYRETYI